MRGPLFMKKDNRDRAWYEAGKPGRRTASRGQQIHPMYVSDYEHVTGTVLTEADKGFGNTIYRTYFSVLYTWEA
jgi:hypothetical protein